MRLSKKRRVETLMRVARHIRRWPHLFSFYAGDIPKKGKACPACMLARAGVLLGVKAKDPADDLRRVARALGFGDAYAESAFYNRVMATPTARSNGRSIGYIGARDMAQAIEEVAASL